MRWVTALTFCALWTATAVGADRIFLDDIDRWQVEVFMGREGSGATVRARTDDYGHSIYYQPSDFDMVNRITEVARQRGVSNARIALAWVAQQPGITAPIFGASKPGHLEDDVAALEIKLDDSELKALAEPYQPHRASDFRARV